MHTDQCDVYASPPPRQLQVEPGPSVQIRAGCHVGRVHDPAAPVLHKHQPAADPEAGCAAHEQLFGFGPGLLLPGQNSERCGFSARPRCPHGYAGPCALTNYNGPTT